MEYQLTLIGNEYIDFTLNPVGYFLLGAKYFRKLFIYI